MIDKFLLDKKDFSEVDAEDVELIRQRDAKRLHTMEQYCKITGCLRNYILDYFGEKTYGACANCGNCHREYKETDMTAQAKWVINCVYETRGRYGLGVVLGTLMGANRAKLREVGATEYKSYGSLRDCKETMIRLLIEQMVQEGYLYQTDDKYSVLRMGPEMNKLREENARVIVRMYEEKEPARVSRKSSAKSTDALASAGFDLFEKLRLLRLEIAREESMPPYIIFNDKALIDMCVKVPHTKEEMLNVNGVGENKFAKYGERFLKEIKNFEEEHPNVVISEKAGMPNFQNGSQI